jgi:hypothetical protein
MVDIRNAHRILAIKPAGERSVGKPKRYIRG